MQGCNARKVISEVYAFFVLQCTVFGRKSKHKTDVTAWHGIHFHKNNLWSILVIGNYYVNFENYQNLDKHWCIYSCLQIPPRENWFQCVRRVYATANNFPCITFLELVTFEVLTFYLSVNKHFQVWFTKPSLSKRLHDFRGKTRWQQVGWMEYRK